MREPSPPEQLSRMVTGDSSGLRVPADLNGGIGSTLTGILRRHPGWPWDA